MVSWLTLPLGALHFFQRCAEHGPRRHTRAAAWKPVQALLVSQPNPSVGVTAMLPGAAQYVFELGRAMSLCQRAAALWQAPLTGAPARR